MMAAMCLLCVCTLQGCAGYTDKKENTMNEEQTLNMENTIENTQLDTMKDQEETEKDEMKTIILTVNNQVLTAKLVDNSSADALVELLQEGPLSIQMSDYGNMEKVGEIGTNLPTNNNQITTEAGDLILYMGNSFVIYYAPNSWNFTRLGKIQNVTADELKRILGNGDVTVTLSLTE